ncbi:MAG: hypothetical protein L0J57_09140 [Brachybacterium sp.]|nr:hypothetical protein [Brachybacterium sp.]
MTGIIRAALLQIARSRGILAATLTAVLIAGGLPLILQPPGHGADGAPAAVLTQATIRTAQLALITAASLVGGTQFRDGHHGTAVLAVPRRGRLLTAQGIAAAVWAVPAATITAVTAVVLTHALGAPAMADADETPGASLLGPGASVASAVTMYLLLMMVLAWGLALLLRRAWASAAALCTLCAVVPVLSMMIPAIGVLPGGAGVALLSHHPAEIPGGHPWWLVMWAVAGVAAGSVAMIRRDVDGG